MPKVKILKDRCKGCGLCTLTCPKHCLALGKQFNASGYPYVQWQAEGCTGCAFCAEMCPDIAIRVYREKKAQAS